jgi:MYXO-CTERM domain-containing protein
MNDGVDAAVAVREWQAGRIVGFSHAGNWVGQQSLCDPEAQRLYINAVNWAGLLPRAQNSSVTTAEEVALPITLSAVDPLGGQIAYAVATQPTNGMLTGMPPNLVYTPGANFSGADSFTWTATNARATRTFTVDITVTPVNDAPVATNATATTAEDTAVNITLPASDVDGDALTYALVAGPTAAQGTVTIMGNIARFVPAANFNGPASFTFRANDGTVNSNTATANITVTPVNDAPVAVDAVATTAEDTAVNITLSATDVDSMSLTYTIATQPVNGTVTITGNVARYTPNANFNGSDTFTFRARDGALDSAPASIRVTVTPVNDAPVATNTSATTAEDASATIALTASDVDMDPLTYAVVTQPTNGMVSIVNGQALYTPNANYSGPDSFTFRARDGQLDSNVATVSVTVTPVNDAPTVSDATLTVDEDASASVALNAADLDNDMLTATLGQAPANGAVTINGLDVTYAPRADFNGVDSFTVTVSDGKGGSATATIAVTINPRNDAPVATAQTVNVGEDSVANMITLAGTDIDGDALTFTVATQPTNGTLSGAAPDLVYVPNADFTGTDSFTFTVNDGTVDSQPATVNITIAATNDAPVFVDPTPVGPLTATEGAALTFGLVATDPDGDMLTFAAANLPAGATLDAANGAFSWTPAFDQEGTVALEFSVSDGSLSDTRTIEVVVSFIDMDGDGLPDAWETMSGLNPASPDSDGDTISDAFEVGDWRMPINTDGADLIDAADTDSDNDGRLDIDEAGDADLATDPIDTDMNGTPDFRQTDSDGDGAADGMDNCPLVANPGQEDANGDMIGDACQDDRDGDGVKDPMDNCPNAANADQLDSDMDMSGDVCDADDDQDTIDDAMDNCPLIANMDQLDTDMDMTGDACDTDDDGDMRDDAMDNCPLVANADQLDTDMDGQGDACDLDDDGDGINDDVDTCPLDGGMTADGCPAPDNDKVVSGADEGCGCATVENDRKAPASLTGLLGLGLLGLVGWRRRKTHAS